MKQAVIITAIMVWGLVALEAEPMDILNRIDVTISSKPEENGNVTDGSMRYRINDDLSARIALRNRTNTEPGILEGYFASLNLATTTTTEVYLLPVSFYKRLSNEFIFSLGAGAYFSMSKQQTAGFLQNEELPVTGYEEYNTNSYEDESASRFYGPLIAFSTAIEKRSLSMNARIEAVPVFIYSAVNTFRMSPIVDGRWTDSWDGIGYPYISAILKGRILFLELDVQYEFQRYLWHYAQAISGTPPLTWASSPAEAMTLSHTFTLLTNVLLPLVKNGNVILGYGRKFLWTDAGDQGNYENDKAIFNIGFDFSR
ncbi:MAG: hypothetical protein ABIJ86_05295 [Spirochaetota bacterium]